MCCNPLRMGMISSRHDVLSRTSRTGGQSNRRWGSKAIHIGHSLEDSSLRTRKTALSAEILLGSPKTSRSISERNSRKIRLRCIFRRTLANRCLAAELGVNRRGGQRSVLPREIHLEAAPGAQSLHRSRGPGLGQGGKQVDLAVGGVTLKQHLGNAGREGEVAVHLKRRVAAEEVGIDAAGLEAEGLPAAAASDPAAMGAGSLPWRPGDLLQPLKLAAAESRSVTEPACSILSASSFTMMVPSSAFARRWHSKLIPSPSSVGA